VVVDMDLFLVNVDLHPKSTNKIACHWEGQLYDEVSLLKRSFSIREEDLPCIGQTSLVTYPRHNFDLDISSPHFCPHIYSGHRFGTPQGIY